MKTRYYTRHGHETGLPIPPDVLPPHVISRCGGPVICQQCFSDVSKAHAEERQRQTVAADPNPPLWWKDAEAIGAIFGMTGSEVLSKYSALLKTMNGEDMAGDMAEDVAEEEEFEGIRGTFTTDTELQLIARGVNGLDMVQGIIDEIDESYDESLRRRVLDYLMNRYDLLLEELR